MLSADRRLLLRVTNADDGLFVLFISVVNLTYSCHCLDCKAITRAHFSRAQLMRWGCQSPKAFTVPTECRAPFCSINLSLSTNLSLIISSWHLWGGWWRGMGSELALIVEGAGLKWCSTRSRTCCSNPAVAGMQPRCCPHFSPGVWFWTAGWSSLFNRTIFSQLRQQTKQLKPPLRPKPWDDGFMHTCKWVTALCRLKGEEAKRLTVPLPGDF